MHTMSFVTVWTCKHVTEMHKNKCEAMQHSAAVPILDYEINACWTWDCDKKSTTVGRQHISDK